MYLDRIIAVRNDKTVYRDDDLCLKVFGEEYSKTHVLSEALNQALAEEAGLNVPKVHQVAALDGKWALISEYIRGKTLAQLIQENPKKKNSYLELLVRLQLGMQAKECPPFPRLRDKLSRKIDASGLPTEVRYELHVRLDGLPEHRRICHGDFEPSNVILFDGEVPFILDWPHAAEGNACFDAAHSYLRFWLNGDIDGAEKYLELYCEKSGSDKKQVLRWMPFAAAARLSKCRAVEREFLHSWISLTD